MANKIFLLCLCLGVAATKPTETADSTNQAPMIYGNPWMFQNSPWAPVPWAVQPNPWAPQNNPWIPPWVANAPWMPKWATCGTTPLGTSSCIDCNTRLLCTKMGGLQKACTDPLLPYCDLGACVAIPNAGCAANTTETGTSGTHEQVNVAELPAVAV